MNYVKNFSVLILAVLILSGINGFSQQAAPQQVKQQEPTKKWIYEFNVSGMRSERDAAKLDSAMISMTGIHSCKTDLKTKKVVVSCRPTMGYYGLKLVVEFAGFIADETYVSLREEM